MKIAIGSDHRGAEIATMLTKNVFFCNHYGEDAEFASAGKIVGAWLLEGAFDTEIFKASASVAPTAEARMTRLRYRGRAIESVASDQSVDYPDVAAAVASAVSEGRADCGVLICGTGVGMCIAANKFPGVRAALCYNTVAAELSRRHNNANVLCLSGEFLGAAAIEAIVRLWMTTPFDGGRHQRRLDLLTKIEEKTGL